MKTWKELLGVVRAVEERAEEYGPHTKELLSLAAILQRAAWYANVNKPSSLDHTVTRVNSWNEAWIILGDLDEVRYTVHGSLVAACGTIDHALHRDPQRRTWARTFRQWSHAAFTIPAPPRAPSWSRDQFALALDYPVDVIEYAILEIAVSDVVDCTYFREHFQWFAYGYFPCGWDGEWPAGKLRVF